MSASGSARPFGEELRRRLLLGTRALGASMSRRGLGYVVAAAFVALLAGSAGMYGFERDAPGTGIHSFGDALWWTAMLITTIGSE